jgi:hypothetical protein
LTLFKLLIEEGREDCSKDIRNASPCLRDEFSNDFIKEHDDLTSPAALAELGMVAEEMRLDT